MSTGSTSQAATEEVAKRFAEGYPSTLIAGKLVGLQDYQARAAMHRKQVARDYAQQNALLESFIAHDGGPTVAPPDDGGEGEELGDIILTGDINVTNQDQLKQAIELLKGKALSQTTEQNAPTATPQAAPAKSSSLPTWALIGGMALSGLGSSGLTALALSYLNKPAAPIVKNIGSDRQYGIKGFVDEVK